MMYALRSLPQPAQPVILVIDYSAPLERFRTFFERIRLSVPDNDVMDFFQGLLASYFYDRGPDDFYKQLFELVEQESDYIEHTGLAEHVLEIVEMIYEITHYHWPRFNMRTPTLGVIDSRVRKTCHVLELEIDGRFLT